MKSINETEWRINNIPERLILKKKQDLNISFLLSKIFIDKKYSDEEIHNSINKNQKNEISYTNNDFVSAGRFIKDCYINKKKILIFGDYDVDGYSSTFLIYDYLTNINLECDYYIPDRFIDGYGPNKLLLKKLIHKKNYGLIIFLDCASNSIEEILYLEKCGLKNIIIDHHQIYEQKTFNNTIIINPQKELPLNIYSKFCATTLSYFFLKYLENSFKFKKNINFDKYLFLSAIATICDQMPLRNHNKVIVENGLKNFNINKFYNIKKLINTSLKVTSSDIGFTLGPILNSASRLGYSNLPFKLLIEKKNTNIDKLIIKLITLNEKRKKIQANTVNMLTKKSQNNNSNIIFKYEKNINEGLLGIIAANFVERFNKPSFILTNSGNSIKCSSRSISGFDIGNIFHLAVKKKIITKGGGHSMAGGCILKKDKLNEFNNFLEAYYQKKFKTNKNIKYYISDQSISSLFTFAKNELHYLEPIGNSNLSPFFLIRKNKIIKINIIKDMHLQLFIKNQFKKSCTCFAFNAVGTKLGDLLMNKKKEVDLIVQINNKIIKKNNNFNLIIKDAIA